MLRVEPLERGKGFDFENKIRGGIIPTEFIPSIERGIREAMEEGVIAGYPVVDIKVTLYDGSFHEVDSSDIAFKIASAIAFRNAVGKASPFLMEPIMKTDIYTPEKFLGDVIADLNTRRAKIVLIDTKGNLSAIRAFVPLGNVFGYATDLRSITQGRATFTLEFSHYEKTPNYIQEKILLERKGIQNGEKK